MEKSSSPLASPDLQLYTVAETAAILSVSKKSVFNWIREGALPAVRLGPTRHLIRVRRQDLEAFVHQNQPSIP